jgi:hypothetical protein
MNFRLRTNELGGVAERLIAPVLKFEFKILDSVGLLLPALSPLPFLAADYLSEDGQVWTAIARIFFQRSLLRVTSSAPHTCVYLAKINSIR